MRVRIGVLVTTSKFGPDSYDFAFGKPITLIDGQKLLGLLMQHGYKFTIDSEAARRTELQSFVSERKIVVGLNYADSAVAEVITLMGEVSGFLPQHCVFPDFV